MTMQRDRRGSLERYFAISVGLGLLVFSLVVGAITYTFVFRDVIANFERTLELLVRTVQAQAEVAVFARNNVIGEGVIEGLLASPLIREVRINGQDNFHLVGRKAEPEALTAGRTFPLYEPIGTGETIGEIILVRDETAIRGEARFQALRQTGVLLLQVLLATALMFFATRQLVSKPVIDLTRQLAAYRPGTHMRIQTSPLHAHDELGLMARSMNRLIESAETALAEVNALATTDPLTQLPNRRHFMSRLNDEFQRWLRHPERPVCLVMMDLDHFKQVNDRYGHAGGDALLREFSALLLQGIRKVDTPGRLGGEEFVILMPDTYPAEATAVADRIRESLAQAAIEHENGTIRATVSVGVAQLLPGDLTPERALNVADQALYQAKEQGRNRVVVIHQ